MTFLQICQEANRICGLQGTVASTTVTSGYQETLVKFCKQAYIELQEYRPNWPWMRSSATFNTVASTTEYSLQTIMGIGNTVDIDRWVKGMIVYTDSDDATTPLHQMSYNSYIVRDVDDWGTGAPSHYAEDPVDRHLWINPPDTAYSITAYYYTRPVHLSASSDIPVMPVAFHMLIAFMGATHMAGFLGNSNLYNTLGVKSDNMLGMLLRANNPAKRARVIGAA